MSSENNSRTVSPRMETKEKSQSRPTTPSRKDEDDNEDFNNEEIQRNMSGVIENLQKQNFSHGEPNESTQEKRKSTSSIVQETNSTKDDSFSPKQTNITDDQDEKRNSRNASPKSTTSRTKSPVKAEMEKENSSRKNSPTPKSDQNDSRRSSRSSTPKNLPKPRKQSSEESSTERGRSPLIKEGEKLEIPNNNERESSPPPSTIGISRLALFNPLAGNGSFGNNERQQTKSPTASTHSQQRTAATQQNSNETRRSSNASQTSTKKDENNTNSASRKGSPPRIGEISSRSGSQISKKDFDTDEKTISRKESHSSAVKNSSRRESQVSNKDGQMDENTNSRRQSTTSVVKNSSRRESVTSKKEIENEQNPSSRRQSTSSVVKNSSRRESTSSKKETKSDQNQSSRNGSPKSVVKNSSRRESTTSKQEVERDAQQISRKDSSREDQLPKYERPPSRQSFFNATDEPVSNRSNDGKDSPSKVKGSSGRRSAEEKTDDKLTRSPRSSPKTDQQVLPVRVSTNVDYPVKSPTESEDDDFSTSIKQTVVPPLNLERISSSKENTEVKSNKDSPKKNQESSRPNSARVESTKSKKSGRRKLSDASTTTDQSADGTWAKTGDNHSTRSSESEPLFAKGDRSRPKSPNAIQIDARNENSLKTKRKKTDVQKRKDRSRPSIARSTSNESFSNIPIVDDKSLDSGSSNNTDNEAVERPTKRLLKKSVETKTNTTIDNELSGQDKTTNGRQTQKVPQPVGKGKTRKDVPSETEEKLLNDEAKALVEKHKKQKKIIEAQSKQSEDMTNGKSLSDTEQILTETQKKRRRPKRISRTSQTDERVFRRLAREATKELRPTAETEKNTQTRKSQLRSRTRSPKRQIPVYLSTDAFKIEEILPKQFPQTNESISRTALIAQSSLPQGGKLLILRPTLPLHHSDAVRTRRVCLQYAIDLIPNSSSTSKSPALERSEQSNNLPALRSSSVAEIRSKTDTKSTSINRNQQNEKSNNHRLDFRANPYRSNNRPT